MTSIAGPNWIVHNADCREAFAALPAGSVHCVMTSPPYWGGIRDYQIAPQVCGGARDCEHDWGCPGAPRRGANRRANAESQGKHRYAAEALSDATGSTCAKCGAWLGCYGNEPTVQQYVAHTLEIFDVLRHVLRDDGVIFWNLGDTYADATKWGGATGGKHVVALHGGTVARQKRDAGVPRGNKSLVPFRVAIALQDAGWIVRQDIVWAKPSPMPESIDGVRWERCRVKVRNQLPPTQVTALQGLSEGRRTKTRDCIGGAWIGNAEWSDCPGCPKCTTHGGYVLRRGSWRPTTAHEFVLMVTKGTDYFCDAAAAKEPCSVGSVQRFGKNPSISVASKANGQEGMNRAAANARMATCLLEEGRNPRSVWRISSEAYKGKHFAAFPTMLAWKCIQAATSAAGCCPACGAQYAPVVEKARVPTRPGNDTKVGEYAVLDPDSPYQDHAGTICGNRDPQRHIAVKRTLGHRPTCDCNAGDPIPATVADPFTGSGTTLQVAINTGRQFVGAEIAAHYLPLIQERAATPWKPRDEQRAAQKKRRKHRLQQSLF